MERGPLDHVEEQETPIFAEEDNTKRDDDVENTRRNPKRNRQPPDRYQAAFQLALFQITLFQLTAHHKASSLCLR